MSAESGKAQPVAGLRIVGWMTERDRDESFPRLHKHEADAAYWVGVFTLPPRVTMRPVYAIDPCSSDPVRAALVEALKEARKMVEEWGAYASPYFQEKHNLKDDLAKLDAALRAAGVVLS